MASDIIQKIAVIGPGMMGHAIAQEFAVGGFNVRLYGRSENRLKQAMASIDRNLTEMVDWEMMSVDQLSPSLNRIHTTTDLNEAGAQADIVIEAVVENLETKNALFRRLDSICPPHTVFASNSSSLLPSTMAKATERSDRFLVAHYFNPPFLMPLVEIVRGENTSDDTVRQVYDLMISIGKSPIICQKEALGFIANRMQLVLWREAFNIVQRGIASPQDVDLAVKNSFGRRLGVAGPFEIYEHNDGYDLTLQCEKYMLPDMDTSSTSYPLLLEMVAKGKLGAKTGQGFYDWTSEFKEQWRKRMLRNLVKYRKSEIEAPSKGGN